MEYDNQHLLQPLISSATTTTITANAATIDASSTPFPSIKISPIDQLEDRLGSNIKTIPSSSNSTFGIISRLVLVSFIGIISMWENHEDSKGFSISIVNEARDTLPGKRFQLFYVSNDEASRLLLSTTSKFVENFLYPNISYPKKQVNHVVLRLSSRNLSQPIIVDSGQEHDQFVLHISPSILEEIDFKRAMFVAMQHGMVRLWLWDDGLGNVPLNLISGIVEYVSKLSISGGKPNLGSSEDLDSLELDQQCWKSKNAKDMAQFLNYYELKNPGFIRRLNQGMKIGWHDEIIDDALGMHVQHLCN